MLQPHGGQPIAPSAIPAKSKTYIINDAGENRCLYGRTCDIRIQDGSTHRRSRTNLAARSGVDAGYLSCRNPLTKVSDSHNTMILAAMNISMIVLKFIPEQSWNAYSAFIIVTMSELIAVVVATTSASPEKFSPRSESSSRNCIHAIVNITTKALLSTVILTAPAMENITLYTDQPLIINSDDAGSDRHGSSSSSSRSHQSQRR